MPSPEHMAMCPMAKIWIRAGMRKKPLLRICSDGRGHLAYRRWNAGSRGTHNYRVVGGRRASVPFAITLLMMTGLIHRSGAQRHGK